jgi:hypothetical protein
MAVLLPEIRPDDHISAIEGRYFEPRQPGATHFGS